MPNLTFALLGSLSVVLAGTIGWSTHHLLLAGAPAITAAGTWPGFACLLLPAEDDIVAHAASYAFLLAVGAGLASGVWAVVRQYRRTVHLLEACMLTRVAVAEPAELLARQIGLTGRVDVVEISTPLAFCYGFVRPRVLVSRGLIDALSPTNLRRCYFTSESMFEVAIR